MSARFLVPGSRRSASINFQAIKAFNGASHQVLPPQTTVKKSLCRGVVGRGGHCTCPGWTPDRWRPQTCSHCMHTATQHGIESSTAIATTPTTTTPTSTTTTPILSSIVPATTADESTPSVVVNNEKPYTGASGSASNSVQSAYESTISLTSGALETAQSEGDEVETEREFTPLETVFEEVTQEDEALLLETDHVVSPSMLSPEQHVVRLTRTSTSTSTSTVESVNPSEYQLESETVTLRLEASPPPSPARDHPVVEQNTNNSEGEIEPEIIPNASAEIAAFELRKSISPVNSNSLERKGKKGKKKVKKTRKSKTAPPIELTINQQAELLETRASVVAMNNDVEATSLGAVSSTNVPSSTTEVETHSNAQNHTTHQSPTEIQIVGGEVGKLRKPESKEMSALMHLYSDQEHIEVVVTPPTEHHGVLPSERKEKRAKLSGEEENRAKKKKKKKEKEKEKEEEKEKVKEEDEKEEKEKEEVEKEKKKKEKKR